MEKNRLIALALVSVLAICQGAVVKGGFNSTNLPDDAGICHLEVPTIDLLTPDQKLGPIPSGNGTRSGYSKIQICCSGWKIKPHTAFRCEPVCDNGCENGNCTAPNVCTCHKNYIKSPDGVCVPSCPIGCLNGVCATNGKCSCNSGFILDPSGKMCLPYCSKGCGIGGQCVGPETCQCKPGFQVSSQGLCEHHCDGGCTNGECIGPNQCSCKPGYKLEKNSCEPMCPGGCQRGTCSAPNKCTCPQGWTLDKSGHKCLAHCEPACLNGECTGPGECTCKPGYIKDTFNPNGNRCVAHCPGGCENGQCSAPSFCICNIGFIKESKGSNKCIRRVKRSNFHPELIPLNSN